MPDVGLEFLSATIWAQGERIHLDRFSAFFVFDRSHRIIYDRSRVFAGSAFVVIAVIVSFRIEVICMLDEDFASQFIRACRDGA